MKFKTDTQKHDIYQKLVKWLGTCENSASETHWNNEAEEDYKFYAGDQDTNEVKVALEAQHRPDTTYNEIKPKIDMLVGMAAQMEGSPTITPRGFEDAPLTELIVGTVDYFRDKMRMSRKENNCFEHAVKSGGSWLHFYIDDTDPDDLIKVVRIPGRDMHSDPDSIELDKSDARFLFRDKWFTIEDIEAAWPDREFAKDSNNEPILGTVTAYSASSAYTPTFFNEANDKYRIVEAWWRVYEKRYTFLNPLNQKTETLFEEEFKELKSALKKGIELPNGEMLQKDTLDAIPQTVRSIYFAIFDGLEIIEIGRSIYKHKRFPYVYLEAYHNEDMNTALSVISSMKDPQRGLNTTRRQLVHLLQTSPKGILLHEIGAILNIEDYEENSSRAGFHLELNKGGLDKVEFSSQPQISNIYSQLDTLFQQSMKDSSGIQDALLGIQTSTREPGITARMRLDSSTAVLYVLFENLKEFKFGCTVILVSLIQQFITTEQAIRIKGPEGMQLIEINSQMNPQLAGWNDISAGKFDLIIDPDIVTKSTKLAVAQILTDFAQNNPGSIPASMLLEYSNLPYLAQQKVQQYEIATQDAAAKQAEGEHDLEMGKLNLEEREVIVKERELDHTIEMDNKGIQSKKSEEK